MGLGPVLNVLIQLRLSFREIIQGEVFSEEWRALVAECAGIHKHAHTHAHTCTHSLSLSLSLSHTHTHTHTHTQAKYFRKSGARLWQSAQASTNRCAMLCPFMALVVCCSVLQYVAVCCSMLQCETARCCVHLWHW